MILKKEFAFVRHGQTEHNRLRAKVDHEDIPLNETGRNQAKGIAPLMVHFKSIYCSPMKRAKETKELFAPDVPHQEVADLGECTARIWNDMTALGPLALSQGGDEVERFLIRVKQGLNRVLGEGNSPLIVSHGGVHWAICCWMGIENYSWIIGNCEPVHFSINDRDEWRAKRL